MSVGAQGPRPGGVAPPPGRRRGRRTAGLIVVAWIVSLAVAVGCSPSDGESPGSLPSATPTADDGPTPKPTGWPTLTIEAAIALAAANNEFPEMLADIVAAVDSEDPARIQVAMNDALAFLTGNEKSISRLQSYEGTRSLGDRLAPTYATMIAGATQVRDGIIAGDGAAVEAGFATFSEGQTAYAAISGEVSDAGEQALFMKRILVR